MLVYKLLFFATRPNSSFFLRSAAINLPDWLVEWYKEGVETKMRFPDMPLWACADLSLAIDAMGYIPSHMGHYEIWECEGTPWSGNARCLNYRGIEYLKRHTVGYDRAIVKRASLFGGLGFLEGIVFCETIKLLRRVK